ncbi:MAG: thioredoxin domain-containing protein [Chloroflexi bacterium]|nr:thioredoxin domain-containing protein [Chloroflexota bacterium]
MRLSTSFKLSKPTLPYTLLGAFILLALLVGLICNNLSDFALSEAPPSDTSGQPALNTNSTPVPMDTRNIFDEYPPLPDDQLGLLPSVARQMAQVTVRGPQNAQVTVIEIGSYGCSVCRRLHRRGLLAELQAQYPDEVRVAFVSWPTAQWNDKVATEAAFCALEQGHDAFVAYHNAVFDLSDEEYYAYDNMEPFLGLAQSLSLNMEEFSTCVFSGKYRNIVFALIEAGTELGLRGTPTFFVNGTPVSYQDLDTTIQAALK